MELNEVGKVNARLDALELSLKAIINAVNQMNPNGGLELALTQMLDNAIPKLRGAEDATDEFKELHRSEVRKIALSIVASARPDGGGSKE